MEGTPAMSGITGSTLPRRQLGRHLRTLRKEAGLTIAKAAVAVELSTATINRIEAGQTSLKARDVRAFCEVYDAPAEMTAYLVTLAGQTKSRGWWQEDQGFISPELSVYLGYEEAATTLLTYESELIPGILQTADYTRAVMEVSLADHDDAALNGLVGLRQRRQVILARAEFRPTVVSC